MLKAVIFDMDGTIVISEPFHFQAFCEVFAKFGIKYEYDEFTHKFAGTGSKNIFTKIFKEHGIKEDITTYAEEKKDILQKLLRENKLEIVKGFKKFFVKIKQKGIKTAIASGTSLDNIELTLQNIGFEKDFEVLTSGREVANNKPAPDILLLTAKRLKVKPEECLVIEDAISGVLSAKNAGMRCIAVATTTKTEALKKAGADLVVEDFTEINLENNKLVL